MKLLIVSESPLEKIGQEYYAVDTWIHFIGKLSGQIETTLLCPVLTKGINSVANSDAWIFKVGNLRIEHKDWYNSFSTYYRLWIYRMKRWKKDLEQLIEEHDVVLIRLPSPSISMVFSCALRKRRPLIAVVAGNIETASDRIIHNRGLKRLFYSLLVKLLVLQEKKWVQQASLVYVYNKELAYRHRKTKGKLIRVRTPHLNEADFKYRSDTCQSQPIRLLSVCWLNPAKGLDYLLEAVSLLIKKGFNIQLEIVGKERIPGYQSELEDQAEELGIRDRVDFRGWVPFDRVGEVYCRNDIQVISSLSEGTPRCIVEGAARGLPLVSTTAGGASEVLIHEQDSLFVPPGDPKAIAGAVERLISDPILRKKLIGCGYEAARMATFEELGMQIVGEICEVARSS